MLRHAIADSRHYDALDGLRGVAALFVVALHVGVHFHTPLTPWRGYLAVDFFFMLSGFVIAHAYDERLRAGLGVTEFFKIRAVRLYPLILLGLTMGAIAWLARARLMGDVAAGDVLWATAANVLLLPTAALSYVTADAFPINSPLWSLSAEILVNILYAAAFSFLTLKRLAVVAAVGALALVWAVGVSGTLNIGFDWSDFPLSLVRAIYPFSVGVILRRFTNVRTTTLWGYASAVLLGAVLAAPVGLGPLFDIGAVLFIFPLIVVLAARADPIHPLGAISRELGALSYPLYITHFPLVTVLSSLAHRRGLAGRDLYIAALASFFLAVVFASIVAARYDAPARRMLRRLLADLSSQRERGAAVKPKPPIDRQRSL